MLLPKFRSSPGCASSAPRSTGRRRRHRFAPDLLALEARALLSTLTVMNDNDSGSGSLRYELSIAQPNDIIDFSPKAYGTITLTSGSLSVATSVDIKGPGANKVTVSGDNTASVLVIESGVTATISGLTITDGSYAVPGGFGAGGILNYGTLTLTDAVVTGNSVASGSYGAGGIFNAGTLTIAGSSISDNVGDFGTGINSNGPLTIADSEISDNSPTPNGGGAAIFSFADTTLTDCVVSGNTSGGIDIAGGGYGPSAVISTLTVSGSTIEDNSEDSDRGPALGAAIDAGGADVNISNCLIADNTASSYLALGGAIHMAGSSTPGASILTITGSTFAGNQALTSFGTSGGGAIYSDPSATVSVTNSSFVDNTASSNSETSGGAMDFNSLVQGTITGCHFIGNQAVAPATSTDYSTVATGGAISNDGPSSRLTISGSTFAHNQALAEATDGFGEGGAIVNQFGATLILSSSSLSNNSAIGGLGGGFGVGGGLANQFNSGATVTGTSFLGNQAVGGASSQAGGQAGPGWGGAIANTIGSTLTMTGSTVAANSAVGGAASDGATPGNGVGGGILNSDGSTLQVTGGVIIGNSAIGGAGGGSGQGGGVFNSGTGSNASLTGVLITLNTAIGGSGGGKGYGGGIYIGTGAITTLKNALVLGNFASTAGNNIDGTYTGT